MAVTKQPLTMFYNSGKTFIGGLCTLDSSGISIDGVGNITSTSDYYVISSPCEVEFELVEVAGSTSRIEFKRVMPICPIKMSSKNGNGIYFVFDKKTTAISNITGASINSTLTDAYRKMTGVTTIS